MFGWLTKTISKLQPIRYRPHSKVTVNSLPDELLEQIFLFACEHRLCGQFIRSQHEVDLACSCALPAELSLSAVSRRWRVVVLGYSQLWTNVRISSSTTPAMLELYLIRSGNRHLNLQLGIKMRSGASLADRPISRAALRTLTDTVLRHLSRWRQLQIITPFPDLLESIMSSLSCAHLCASSLEVLAIECTFQAGLPSGNGNMYTKPFPAGAPRLQHVQLHRCCFPMQENESLPELRSFDVASAPWALSDLHILSNASPQLTHLALTSSYKLDTHVRLDFPVLRTLRVGDYFQNTTILRLLEAPNLEVLQIEDMEVQFNVTAGWYVDALKGEGSCGNLGKFPRLRSLRLQMPGSPEDPSPLIVGERFRQFLALFPSIEHLAFVGLHVHQFVRGLCILQSATGREPVLLPRLARLTLGSESELTTLGGERGLRFLKLVVSLVRMRGKANVPLRKVQIPENVLARDRYLPRKMLVLLRLGSRKAVKIEGLRMPYSPDVWLGHKSGIVTLQEQGDKTIG